MKKMKKIMIMKMKKIIKMKKIMMMKVIMKMIVIVMEKMKKIIKLDSLDQDNKELYSKAKNMCFKMIDDLKKGKKPKLEAVKCSLDNAIYDSKLHFLRPGDKTVTTELNVSSIKKLTRTIIVLDILLENSVAGYGVRTEHPTTCRWRRSPWPPPGASGSATDRASRARPCRRSRAPCSSSAPSWRARDRVPCRSPRLSGPVRTDPRCRACAPPRRRRRDAGPCRRRAGRSGSGARHRPAFCRPGAAGRPDFDDAGGRRVGCRQPGRSAWTNA